MATMIKNEPQESTTHNTRHAEEGAHYPTDGQEGLSRMLKKPRTQQDEAEAYSPEGRRSEESSSNKSPVVKSFSVEGGKGLAFELSKKRRVTVKAYNGKPLVDIREFYEDNGTMKPGKKGISLTLGQWEALKSIIQEVDKKLESLDE